MMTLESSEALNNAQGASPDTFPWQRSGFNASKNRPQEGRDYLSFQNINFEKSFHQSRNHTVFSMLPSNRKS
jgi:hypothetical protein